VVERVLIQKLDGGEFASPNHYIAWRGFEERGIPTGFFTFADLRDGRVELSPSTMLVGGAGAVTLALRRLGVAVPTVEDLPEPLAFLRGRKVWASTLGDVRAGAEHLPAPVFVKPLKDPKAFPGQLVGAFRDILPTVHLPDEMPVLISEAVDFVSEWRFFVMNREVVGAGHYGGDPRRLPDGSRLDAAIAAWGDAAPAGYAIDLGVTADGRTLLVEVNDGYSLGATGLKPMRYSLLLQTRWVELMRSASAATADATVRA
jgi:hypothetical protein